VDYSDKKKFVLSWRRLYSVSLWEGESQCRRTEAKEQEVWRCCDCTNHKDVLIVYKDNEVLRNSWILDSGTLFSYLFKEIMV